MEVITGLLHLLLRINRACDHEHGKIAVLQEAQGPQAQHVDDRGRIALGLFLGLLVVKSVAAYFSHPNNPTLRYHYGTEEVALAKRIAAIDPYGTTYVLGPDVTY